jgi:hypothetical protein
MDKTSFNNSSQPQISEGLKEYINSMVEEVVLNGKSFDETKKKWLKKFCDAESLNYANFESNLSNFFELVQDYRKSQSTTLRNVLQQKSRDSFIEKNVLEKCLAGKALQLHNNNKSSKLIWLLPVRMVVFIMDKVIWLLLLLARMVVFIMDKVMWLLLLPARMVVFIMGKVIAILVVVQKKLNK